MQTSIYKDFLLLQAVSEALTSAVLSTPIRIVIGGPHKEPTNQNGFESPNDEDEELSCMDDSDDSIIDMTTTKGTSKMHSMYL